MDKKKLIRVLGVVAVSSFSGIGAFWVYHMIFSSLALSLLVGMTITSLTTTIMMIENQKE